MDYSDIGLDLFMTPFGSTPAAAPAPKRETPKPQQPKATVTQQAKTAVTQPKVPASSAQQPNAPEKKRTEPSLQNPHTEIKAPEQLMAQPHMAVKNPEPVEPKPETKVSEPAQSQPEAKTSEPAQPQSDVKAPESTQSKTDAKISGQPQPEPPKELSLDMSDHSIHAGEPLDSSEDAKRKAHEEAEAKRRAEWEAKQTAKKKAREEALEKIKSMNDADIVSASTERIRADVERLTRRNMKEYIAEHIQNLCRKDPAFARKTMNPKKSMIHCFHYINRMAKEYIRKEMEDNDIKPENGVYGGDVPDDLCYQWAEDYFNAPDAEEDKEKEEKFVSRPYVSTASKSTKTPTTKKAAKKEPVKKKEPEGQMSFTEVLKC